VSREDACSIDQGNRVILDSYKPVVLGGRIANGRVWANSHHRLLQNLSVARNMSTSTKVVMPISTLRKDPRSRFLEGLALSERESILRAATQRQFLANSVVLSQGNPANNLFLLITGRARHFFITENGHKILLNWLVPGDTFGGYAMLATPASYLVSTETVKDSRVLVWDHVTIRGLVARYPRLLDNGLLTAGDYLAWYLAANVALTCHPARQRLAEVLVSLARGIGEKVSGGIELDFTNEELADAANVTLFTASRVLNQWQREGLVVKSRGKVLLHSPERLLVHASNKIRDAGTNPMCLIAR
jgi:CRP-like cAMP-binding protein